MSERLAIVGGSVRAAAASAVRAGFQVVTVDRFADADLQQIAQATRIDDYPSGLSAWLRAIDPPARAWMYTGALENHPELVDEMAGLAPLWGNPGDVLRQVRSAWKLAEVLRGAGLLFPEMRDSPVGLSGDGTWLAKTGRGASGTGVTAFVGQTAEAVIYQWRVAGIPCSAVYVAAGGRTALLGIARQLVGEVWLHAEAFQHCGAIGPWLVAETTRPEIRGIGDVLAARFGLRGLFGVDFILDGERVWTVEVNPRYTASAEIIERATGVCTVAAHAEACCKSTLPAVIPSTAGRLFGKAIVFARDAVTVSCQFKPDVSLAAHGESWVTLADLPAPGTRIKSGQPVLTLLADGLTPDEVVANLKTRVAEIESRLYL